MNFMMLILLAMVGLEGCVTADYGNYTAQTPHTLNTTLLTDTVKQIEALYPPASTQLNIGQAIQNNDPFGAGLIATLRNHGYAVQDYSEQPLSNKGIKLLYLLDVPTTTDQALYRVKIRVGDNTLTRAYVMQNDTVIPAGAWTRREDH
jgi:hypothetical protein